MKKINIVTRFAPSPTGFIHVGNIRTALFTYLFTKKENGVFILRIEDTDKSREVDGSIDHIKSSLQWLGIEWDYGPDREGPFGSCLQSDRLDIYKKYAHQLIEKGFAYPDPYTKKELENFRQKAKDDKRPFLFRDHRPEVFGKWDGKTSLRFKATEIKRYHWNDVVRGDLEAGEEMLDDIILIKEDGYPTYNFAHIVDDIEMRVTHIMRGEEFIASIPKFLSLYDALNVTPPIFVTMPPIMSADGKRKLSKRDGSKDILEYKKEGYLPEAMVNFLAFIGWNPGTEQEIFSMDELIHSFSLERIQKSGGVFNEDKLLWINKEYLQKLDIGIFTQLVIDALPENIKKLPNYSDKTVFKLSPTIQERVSTTLEITKHATAGEYDFAFITPDVTVNILKWKGDKCVKDSLPRLEKVMGLLQEADFSSPDEIKQTIWNYAEEVGKGNLLWPLRVAITGMEKSPDPFTSAYIIGKKETLIRIHNTTQSLKS